MTRTLSEVLFETRAKQESAKNFIYLSMTVELGSEFGHETYLVTPNSAPTRKLLVQFRPTMRPEVNPTDSSSLT